MAKEGSKEIDKGTKQCMICGMRIILSEESYVHLEDYKSGKLVMEGYYHNKCWHDHMGVSQQMRDKAMKMLNIAGNAMKKIGIYPEEEYVVGQ